MKFVRDVYFLLIEIEVNKTTLDSSQIKLECNSHHGNTVEMDKMFTTDEAASYLGVTPSRIRQYIAEKRLKSVKHGRDHMIKASDLESFAKHGKKKRGRPPKKSE